MIDEALNNRISIMIEMIMLNHAEKISERILNNHRFKRVTVYKRDDNVLSIELHLREK